MSQSLYNQALTQYQNNQLPEAIQSLKTLLKNNPHDADSLHLLGVMYYQINQGALAIQSIEKAVAIAPKNADYLNNFGLILKANGKLDDALKAYQNAILINPKDLDIQLNIANLMMETARFEEAAGYYRRLLRVYKPYQAEHGPIRDALCHALSNLGNAASKNGNHIQAEACFAEAVQFNSQDNAYLYNLANAERELGKPKQAAQHYAQAIQLSPNHADAWNNLGNVQRELGEIDKAINSYEKALSIDPDLHHAKVHLVHQKQHACDWKGLDAAIESVEVLVNTVPTAQVSPFAFLAMPGTSRAAQLKCANQWISNRFQGLIKANIDFAQNKKRNKITIGYLSADFRLHPLAFLISDLLECHDRNTFEVIAYSFGANDQSAERKRLAKSVDEFHDIATLSEMDAAKKNTC